MHPLIPFQKEACPKIKSMKSNNWSCDLKKESIFKYHVLESHVQYSNLFWENNDRPLGMKLILPCKTQSNKKQAENSDFLEMRL